MANDPIEGVIERWHDYLRGTLEGGLESLLDDDVVFYSPIVFKPQEGKALTTMYLTAAAATLPGDDAEAMTDTEFSERSFRYTKHVLDGDTAVLEFETTLDGIFVNGVDIIRCNDAGRIVEFRVMIRPRKGVDVVQERMRRAIEAFAPPPT